MVKLVLAGAGGHARSVLEAVRTAGVHDIVACTDPRPELLHTTVDGVPIVGDDSLLPGLMAEGIRAACIGVGGTRDNTLRQQLFDRLDELGFELPPIVHPSASVASNAELGSASVVLAGAVVGAGARVAEDVIVNTGSVVEHDCVLEAHVHLATGALLGGGVTVERLAHVGLGASVIHGVRIGAEAIVGAGAVVIRDVEARTTVVGCPAAALRTGR